MITFVLSYCNFFYFKIKLLHLETKMKASLFIVLIFMFLFGCDSADNKENKNSTESGNLQKPTDNNYTEHGKLQELINKSSAGDTIDLSNFSTDDTKIIINKKLTIKNGTLAGISLETTNADVTLQNVTSVEKIINSGSNLTIINTNVSDLFLQNNQSRNSTFLTQANLIGCRVKSLTAESGTNLSIANFNINIDKYNINDVTPKCPENIAKEIGMEENFISMDNLELYNLYDNNVPAGNDVIYVTKNGWPQYAVDYITSLYPETPDIAAKVKDNEKINYYLENENHAKNIFTESGFENIENARIGAVYIPENDKENFSDYKAYLEKIKSIPNANYCFHYFSATDNNCIISFAMDEDGIYYKSSNWKNAVTDYAEAFDCSENEAKMQLFKSTDDAYIETEFGGEESIVAIYPLDWKTTDEAKWIEDVINLKCKQQNLTRENVYRSDSFSWKNNKKTLFIYIDEPWNYENEKFERNDLYYQITIFSTEEK